MIRADETNRNWLIKQRKKDESLNDVLTRIRESVEMSKVNEDDATLKLVNALNKYIEGKMGVLLNIVENRLKEQLLCVCSSETCTYEVVKGEKPCDEVTCPICGEPMVAAQRTTEKKRKPIYAP